ncbi:sugar phosphate isomerase/epimerase family protein [Adhaeribacter radiodurans]|uniref:Sugar phosphate isomerase/epimerase n=1 Tax=Adhaeribacter radiodurans TaxID=2745197 RepID=A0A7L7LDC9_9BACT|nr:sugar phosphate isomerase/epimerase family protein [Adhaeribacter radiodurans]QMU30783.1 sugar phosphate isomerase/epimerase [Adhaeribacter radiodurans]
MIKSCVTIALVPQIKTGPWIYWEDLEASITKAAQLGFDAIELFTASADAVDTTTLTQLLERSGLNLAAVGTGAGKVIQGLTLTDPNPEIRKQAVAFISDMILFGAKFKAPAIIGSMQGNVAPSGDRSQTLEWLAEGLTTLGKIAESNEVNLIYEPLNRYETNLINNLSDGAKFLNSLNTRNVKLLADLFHMNIEESSLPESIRNNRAAIGHIHFADSNRRPVGYGHTSVPEIAAALQEINYDGYLSAEAFPWPNPDDAAQQTITAFNQFFKN